MNYKSNLPQPDIWKTFKHVQFRPMAHSFGHDVPTDWHDKADDDPIFGIWKKCGSFTQDEGAILYSCAIQYSGYPWCDIGCNTGMSSAVIRAATGAPVDCVDYMLALPAFLDRFLENTNFPLTQIWAQKSDRYFDGGVYRYYAGICIDGDHDAPQPLRDAQNASKHLESDGVIVFHDFWGQPVQDAVLWLMNNGFRSRVYVTPHGVAACWRGNFFKPPDHIPDPNLPDIKGRCPNFPFERCS